MQTIERNSEGFLTYDTKAAVAIAGMPPGDVSDKAELLEKQYSKWLGVEGNVPRWFTPWRKLILWIARRPVGIFRLQVAELALGAAKLLNDKRAAEAQLQFYEQYLKMVDANRDLSSFLEEHFRNDLRAAHSTNKPLLEVAKEIMLRRRTVNQ